MQTVAEFSEVSKHYGPIQALSNVSLKIRPGVTGLLGPNGSGKSTLIKALLGLVAAQRGSGSVLGLSWPGQVRAIRDRVGFLPEDDCYIAGLTGIESLTLMAKLSGLPGTEALRRSHEISDFCDIREERYRVVEGYSTGMRQKLKFAQALVHDPPLMILDEPTTGLDPAQRQSMLSRIKTLATDHGKSVIVSTHILPDVRAVCDHVVILVKGAVRLMDTLENLSRPAEPTLQLSVAGNADPLVQRIESEGFAVTRPDAGSILISGIDADQVSRVWQWASDTEVAIRRLEPARHSLEEIFVEATRDAASGRP